MRLDWRSALGIALSVLLLWWTLHDEPLGAVWVAVRSADWRLWAASTVAATLIFPLRARRWRVILAPAVGDVPDGPLWRATAVGMMVNNVAPARAGELARAYVLTREVPRISLAASLASLAVDRVFDALVLLLLLFAAPLDPAFPAGVRIYGQSLPALARVAVLGVLVLLAGLYALVVFPALTERLFRAVVRRVAPRLERRGADALRAFTGGLGVLRHPGRFAAVFGWTLAHWLLAAWSLWLGFRAVGITAPFTAALFLNSVSSVATAVPSSPGFFGVFESVSKVCLRVYGVPTTLAVSWALGYHVLTFIPITVIGAVYAVRLGLGLRELTGGGRAAGAWSGDEEPELPPAAPPAAAGAPGRA